MFLIFYNIECFQSIKKMHLLCELNFIFPLTHLYEQLKKRKIFLFLQLAAQNIKLLINQEKHLKVVYQLNTIDHIFNLMIKHLSDKKFKRFKIEYLKKKYLFSKTDRKCQQFLGIKQKWGTDLF